MIYRYAEEMLLCCPEGHKEILDRIFVREDRHDKRAFLNVLYQSIQDNRKVVSRPDDTTLFKIIVDAAADYIRHYTATAATKQKIYSQLHALYSDIGEHRNIKSWESIIKNNISAPIKNDVNIEFIKALHEREGCTQKELEDKLGVSDRTIREKFRYLRKDNAKNSIRIGGVAVNVELDVANKDSRTSTEACKYYTPNTLSPLVFTMNITQVATLLKSLWLGRSREGMELCTDMAVVVWWQLSDYAKRRIIEYYGCQNEDFQDFIGLINMENESSDHHFMTEEEMLKNWNASYAEELDIIWKADLVYDITLKNVGLLPRCKVRRDMDSGNYYAISVDDLDKAPVIFSKPDIKSLKKSL